VQLWWLARDAHSSFVLLAALSFTDHVRFLLEAWLFALSLALLLLLWPARVKRDVVLTCCASTEPLRDRAVDPVRAGGAGSLGLARAGPGRGSVQRNG